MAAPTNQQIGDHLINLYQKILVEYDYLGDEPELEVEFVTIMSNNRVIPDNEMFIGYNKCELALLKDKVHNGLTEIMPHLSVSQVTNLQSIVIRHFPVDKLIDLFEEIVEVVATDSIPDGKFNSYTKQELISLKDEVFERLTKYNTNETFNQIIEQPPNITETGLKLKNINNIAHSILYDGCTEELLQRNTRNI